MTKLIKQKASSRLGLGKPIIQQAGLGTEVEILVQGGSVLILPSVKPKGWKIWETMSEDATEGF